MDVNATDTEPVRLTGRRLADTLRAQAPPPPPPPEADRPPAGLVRRLRDGETYVLLPGDEYVTDTPWGPVRLLIEKTNGVVKMRFVVPDQVRIDRDQPARNAG